MKLSLTLFSIASIVAVVAQDTAAGTSASATGSGSAVASSTGSAAKASTPATASSSAPSATASSSSFKLPDGISSQCTTFLSNLDADTTLQSCISPALNSLEGSSPSLDTVCAKIAASTCSETNYYKILSYFSGNCSSELITSPNKDVVSIFDSLYVALPFQKAICTKDATGKWCATGSSSNATSSVYSGVSNAAQSPLSTSDGYPNAETFTSDNILFFGHNANMDQASLCTTCLQKVLTIYIGHETTRTYPTGLSGSPLLAVQNDLWTAVNAKCPADFISGALANAQNTPSSVNGAAAFSPVKGATVLFALIAGVIAL